ncbi:MAG TPA: hypothetical protein VIY08_02125 [Candidatus Nitrosocosmicus sp.]
MKIIYAIVRIITALSLLTTFTISSAFAQVMTDTFISLQLVHVGNTFQISAKIFNNSHGDIHFGPCALGVKINNAKILPRVCHHILITLHPGGGHILITAPLKAIRSGPTLAHLTFTPYDTSGDVGFKIYS